MAGVMRFTILVTCETIAMMSKGRRLAREEASHTPCRKGSTPDREIAPYRLTSSYKHRQRVEFADLSLESQMHDRQDADNAKLVANCMARMSTAGFQRGRLVEGGEVSRPPISYPLFGVMPPL
jgi:hypothetical protein